MAHAKFSQSVCQKSGNSVRHLARFAWDYHLPKLNTVTRGITEDFLRKKNELEGKDKILTATEGKTLATEQPFRVGLTQLYVISVVMSPLLWPLPGPDEAASLQKCSLLCLEGWLGLPPQEDLCDLVERWYASPPWYGQEVAEGYMDAHWAAAPAPLPEGMVK